MLDDNTFYLESIDEKWRRSYKFKGQGLKGETLAKSNINSVERIQYMIDKKIPVSPPKEVKSFHKMSIDYRREFVSKNLDAPVKENLLINGGIESEMGDKII